MFELPTLRITAPSQPSHQQQHQTASAMASEENHIDPKFGVAANGATAANTNTNTNSTSKLNTAELNEYLLCTNIAAGTKMDHTNTTATTHSQRNHNLNKISQLKESHSALVKILESAPINSNKLNNKNNKNNDNDTSNHNNNHNNNNNNTSLHHHHHHRKRNKHLIEMHCDDLDKSSDDEMGCNSNSSASSNASEAELICPWKKTRIAREWQQPPPHHYAMTHHHHQHHHHHHHHDKSQEFNDDDAEEDDSNSQCECYNTWRRSSSDSNESIQNNDSGCDSDCPENITELCKKFDENLSEQDGFFRRSIQQKIQYRPCTKNQQCSILRINRNRCQYCRLKKCIAVGMSRDAVRFGRVPKREKARILAAMQQSTQNRGHQRAMATELDDQPRLLAAVLRAHMDTCEFTRDKVTSMRQRARDCPSYSMPTMACPLNPAPELQSEQEFSQRFAHVIRGVIDFAGMIPGFQLLTQDDKFTLLKAGLFDALFVRLICMFDSSINSIICLNGQVMRRNAIQNGANARFLVDSTFNFSERMNAMNLTDSEIGLFCAIVLITPDRPGLRNIELVEKMYSRLKGCLQTVISQNRPDDPDFMVELLKLLPDLRTLSTLHTEKLVVFRTEHKEMLRQQMWSMEEEASSKGPGLSPWGCNDQIMEEVTKSPMGSVSSTESSDTVSDHYTQSLSASAPLLAATLAGGVCPMRLRANSGSSAEDDIVGTAHLTQNGLTITPVVRATTTGAHHIRYRKLDSPTDSGIESGNEKADHKTPSSESSSCSSPRSSVDDINEEKRPIVEDMPVLKRVLQAPPLYDTNSLMDEAYKPHKKFRALRHRESDAEADSMHKADSIQSHTQTTSSHLSSSTATSVSLPPPPAPASQPATQHQSQLHMHLTRPLNSSANHSHHQQSSLSSTHSVLARSLMEEPRMTPEQMKRSDIIQNYIKRESQVEQQHHNKSTTATASSTSSSTSSSSSSPSSHTQGGLLVCALSGGNPNASSTRWQNSAGMSVITTTRQHTPSPSGTSSPRQSPATSPRILELQVDIADTTQPLNLSLQQNTMKMSAMN